MNKKSALFSILILVVWLVVVATSVVLTLATATTQVDGDYDLMLEASTKAQQCFDALKRHKTEDLGIELSQFDVLQTGLIGIEDVYAYGSGIKEYYDHYGPLLCISSTDGDLYAKRTSCDANWAGYMVSLFKRAGLKEGDQIGMTFSGSFPALNVSCMVAADVYGLKTCVMTGIGASYYGANDPRFAFFEMADYLHQTGLLSVKIDYVSWGGEDDVLADYSPYKDSDEIKRLYNRANEVANFIYKPDYAENIAYRKELFKQNVPNIKMFVSVGGPMVTIGTGLSAFEQHGYCKPPRYTYSNNSVSGLSQNAGLLEYYYKSGISVVSLINIKGLATDYGVPYIGEDYSAGSPAVEVGLTESNVAHNYYNFYYSTHYNLVYAIVALVISVLIAVYFWINKSHLKDVKKDERNNILCGR